MPPATETGRNSTSRAHRALKGIARTLAGVSAAGLLLSFISHICSLAGRPGPLDGRGLILHLGIFIVWTPAMLVSTRVGWDVPQKDIWKAALWGCPRWMKYLTYGLIAYAGANFVVFSAIHSPANWQDFVRGFSGHWMALYSAAMSILYSAANIEAFRRRCANGHIASLLAKFCAECGEPMA